MYIRFRSHAFTCDQFIDSGTSSSNDLIEAFLSRVDMIASYGINCGRSLSDAICSVDLRTEDAFCDRRHYEDVTGGYQENRVHV